MSYTDTFGNQTLPPAQYGYSSLTLSANLTTVWPYNSDSTANTLSKIVDIACASGNVLTLPDATQVSVGEDFLLRNVGSFALTIKNASGVQIATVAVGAASYFYLTDNTLVAGVFGVIGFGVGTSTADAGSLVGYGVKAIGASLNQSHPVIPVASSLTLDDTYRAKLVSFTGGTGTFSLTSAATLGDDYFVMIRNNGTGTLTLDPASAELIDGQSSLQLQPSESLMLISTGTQWYSVGYGRSTLYQFTQLTKDVSAGGTFTLSAAEASNKLLTFIGNPASAVTVIVPAIVAVYYTYSNISTAFSVTVKTATGSGTTVPQGTRIVVICDGTNVMSAQSAVANSSVSLTDGSVAVPALFFSSQTNTGLYKFGTNGLGFSVNGVDIWHLTPAGTFLSIPLAVASGGTGASNLDGIVQKTSLTGSAILPSGTTAQRDGSPAVGYTRFNATTGNLETWNGSAWAQSGTLTGTETLSNKTLDSTCNISGSSGQPFSFRNKLINGGMQVAQRGTGPISVVGSVTYTLDRWVGIATGASFTVNQVAYSANTFSHALVCAGAAGNTLAQISQRIESLNTFGLAGGNVTVSGWFFSTDAGNINWGLGSANATDNFTAVTGISSGSIPVPAASYVYHSFQVAIPSGYTGTGLELMFYVNGLLATKQIAFANVQLAAGSIATPFEQRPYPVELAMCQRYYEIGFSSAGSRSGDNVAVMLATFKATKRTNTYDVTTSPSSGGAVTISIKDFSSMELYNNPGAGSSGRTTWSVSAEL